MKTNKLQIRMMLVIGSVVTVIFASVILFISLRVNKIIIGEAFENTREKAGSYAQNLETVLNESIIITRTLAKSMEKYLNDSPDNEFESF
ncbi:MAG: hypothetical protein HC906_14520 [Bacteroidales bacterium]|nr:hypothetical protein [Bacteroidales bacterium]